MSMRTKRSYSLLLALTIVVGLLSAGFVPAAAAGTSSGGVILSKSATLEDDGTYTIDLSGFVTGETVHSQVTTHKPLDVVLVLDASSSMLKFKNTPDTYVQTDKVVGWKEETVLYPATATSTTDLWAAGTGMSRVSMFYSNDAHVNGDGPWVATSTSSPIRGSAMIPVKPKDKIYCSSFRAKSKTGGEQDGICVAFFRSNGKLLKSLSAADVYKEFTESGNEYITVPEGAYAMNVPVWNSDKQKKIYNLSLGEERYNPVNKLEFQATRAKIMQQQVQSFADALAANSKETGAEHKMAIVTFGGGTGTSVGNQGRYEKHVGVNGFNNYIYTNTGLFVNSTFKNYFNDDGTDTTKYPSYAAVFEADLDTSKTYYHFERTTSLDNINGYVRTVTYDTKTGSWINENGKTVVPQAKPYGANSRTQFYTMQEVDHTGIKNSEYKAAMTDLLVDGALNPHLQYAIDRYVARGTTHTELGLAMADEILKNNLPRQHTNTITGKTETCEQVVILFTDGQTNDPDTNDAGVNTYQTIFYRGNRIKHKGAKIYTIGVADMEEEGAKVAPWLDQLSTNHPDVVLTSSGEPVSHGSADTIFDPTKALSGGKYFKSIEDITELNEIFTSITTDISTSTTTVELDESAVMQDQLTGDFKLPDNFGFDNIGVTIVGMVATGSGTSIQYSEKTGSSAVKEVLYNATEDTITNGDVVSASYKYGTSIDLTVSYNKVTGMVSVTGFNYAYYFVAPDRNNGFKLKVQITGVEATDATPTDVLLNTNTNKSGIAYVDENSKSGLHPFEFPKTQLASKSYVMDYAMPLTIDSTDWGLSNIIGFADSSRLKIEEDTRNSFDTDYGTFTKNADGTSFTFTPDNMKWDKPASFYVLHTLDAAPAGVTTGNNQWLKVSVIPANNIYYEDDFAGITYDSEAAGGTWVTDGVSDQTTVEHHEDDTSKVQSGAGETDAENRVHGWESSLTDAKYSSGSAHKAVIGAEDTAEASFSFIGTGVDIYGRTNSTTGTVLATLARLGANGEMEVIGVQIVDTESVSGDYYQIPAVSFMDLLYGTYTVTVRVTTEAEDRFTYYVDGIRVYDPLEDDSAYTVAERGADVSEIRDLLGMQTADAQTGGAVFIDKLESGATGQMKPYDETEYGTYGPKNEVYLAPTQSITFKVESDADAYYYVGLKCPSGTGNLTASVSNGDSTRREIAITHSSDMYYAVLPDADGYITIENHGGGLLSVTKLRIAGASESAQVLTITEEEAVFGARTFLARPKAVEVESHIDLESLEDVDAAPVIETQPSGSQGSADEGESPDSSDVDLSVCIWVLVVSVILLVCCVGGVYEKKVH